MCTAYDTLRAQTFLDACVDAGLIAQIPALTPNTSVASPPDAPRLLVNRRDLPRALRLLVHEENIVRTNRYAAEYRAYLERYGALVDAAENAAALRALGAAATLFVPATEPGLSFDGDDDLVWDFDRRVERLDDSALTHRVHRKTFQFREAA